MARGGLEMIDEAKQNAAKLEAATLTALNNSPPSEAEVLAGTQKANEKEKEFNSEKALIDGLLDSGDTLNSIINQSSNKSSVQGKYMGYLDEKIKEKTEHIINLKHDDKFYRRDFLTANPLLAQAGPFWQNIDNWFLTAFWSAIILNLVPITFFIVSVLSSIITYKSCGEKSFSVHINLLSVFSEIIIHFLHLTDLLLIFFLYVFLLDNINLPIICIYLLLYNYIYFIIKLYIFYYNHFYYSLYQLYYQFLYLVNHLKLNQ
jgi:hypothetical protein